MIPVIINNRNRVTTLKKLIDCLPKDKVEIIILDNDSTYEPLLDFYSSLPDDIRLVKLNKNIGHKALYFWNGYREFKERYFVYTDSDVVISKECPNDFLEHLLEAKKKYNYNKIGLALKIDDLPDHYALKQEVINWERKFWEKSIYDKELNCQFWLANVDTTFAMYDKNNYAGSFHCVLNCLRTDYPYTIQHLPWYIDSDNLDQEEKYYMKTANAKFTNGGIELKVGMWTQMHKKHESSKVFLL